MRVKAMIEMVIILLVVTLLTTVIFAQKDDAKKEETILCPVSGETILKSEAAGPYEYNGTNYYFCCNNCLEKFKKDPETYLNKTKDIVCGMTVDKKTAKKITYEGKDYFFCSDQCKAQFEKEPQAYIQKAAKTLPAHSEGKQAKCCEGDCSKETKTGEKKECCGNKTATQKSDEKK